MEYVMDCSAPATLANPVPKMTIKKSNLRLPTRTPAFVSREAGAAELMISPETWDRWVDDGILPHPAPGFPESTPRWFWPDVECKLRNEPESQTIDPFMLGAGRIKDGPTSKK